LKQVISVEGNSIAPILPTQRAGSWIFTPLLPLSPGAWSLPPLVRSLAVQCKFHN